MKICLEGVNEKENLGFEEFECTSQVHKVLTTKLKKSFALLDFEYLVHPTNYAGPRNLPVLLLYYHSMLLNH